MNKIDKIRHGGLDYDIGDGTGGESIPTGTVVQFDGDTIPEGYEEVSFVQDLADKITNLNPEIYETEIELHKAGNMVTLALTCTRANNWEKGAVLFVLPEEARPVYTTMAIRNFPCQSSSATNYIKNLIRINGQTGEVSITGQTMDATNWISCTATYIVR